MIVAAGMFEVFVMPVGGTMSVAGATPKVHIIIAPLQTTCAMAQPPPR
jgi:hypothetical protein